MYRWISWFIFKIFLIVSFSSVNTYLAIGIISENATSDLNKYILGAEEFGVSYYEPLSLLYLEQARVFSKWLSFDGYLSLQSSIILTFCILFFTRKICFPLKLFWLATLGFVIPLINVRYIVVILVFLVLPKYISKYLLPLCHWNMIVTFIPCTLKQYIKFIIASIFVIPIFLFSSYFGYFDFVFEKISYYILYGNKDYGVGLFLEIILVFIIYRYLYKSTKTPSLLIITLTILSFFMAVAGLPVISSRILVLTFILSLLDLKNSEIIRIRFDIKVLMIIVGIYEIYRIFQMIGY